MTAGRRALLTVIIAATATVIAMLCYPGGTGLDHRTAGYSLTQNFLSDLGMTVSYNGGANRLGAALFVVAMLALVFGGIASLSPLMRALWSAPSARPWLRAAGLCLLVVCVAFTGVAFTPENRAMDLHVSFTVWGWRFIVLVALLLGVAATRAGARYRLAAVAGFATAVLIATYSTFFNWGPDGHTEAGHLVYVVAQKVAAVVVALALLTLARAADSRPAA
jgi:hypothetical protein